MALETPQCGQSHSGRQMEELTGTPGPSKSGISSPCIPATVPSGRFSIPRPPMAEPPCTNYRVKKGCCTRCGTLGCDGAGRVRTQHPNPRELNLLHLPAVLRVLFAGFWELFPWGWGLDPAHSPQ